MKILFFSVRDADGLSGQLKRLVDLGCEVFRVEGPHVIPPHDDYSLGISDRCDFLIPESFNKLTKNGIYNFHPSLLPLHPGSYSQFWSLLFGDPFGVTCHQITNILDRGPIFDIVPIPYSEDETFQEVYERTRTVTEGMIWRLISQHENLAARLNPVIKHFASNKNHTRKTSLPLFEKLPEGWRTKIWLARESLRGVADVNGRRVT